MATGNPFSDESKPSVQPAEGPRAAAEINPYAPPRVLPSELPTQAVERTGLPWENAQSLNGWWQTTVLIFFQPSLAFQQMRVSGGNNGPMIYGTTSVVTAVVIHYATFLALAVMNGAHFDATIVLGTFGTMVMLAMVTQMIGWHINAVLIHMMLNVIGGNHWGYSATYRALAFSNGGTAMALAIPCVGPLIYVLYGLYVNVIAVKHSHGISYGMADFVVLSAFFLLIALGVGIVSCVALMT